MKTKGVAGKSRAFCRRLGVCLGATLMMPAVTASGAGGPAGADAETSPRPPCETHLVMPTSAAVGEVPSIQIWKDKILPPSFSSPACPDWLPAQSHILVAVAATFRATGGSAGLLSRFGDIPSLLLVRYWSTTDQAWRPVFTAATALTNQPGGRPRGAFTSSELTSGAYLYLSQREGRTGNDVVYRMRLLKLGPGRFVVETENVTRVRWLAFTLFEPGALRSLYSVEQRSPDTWSYYALTSVTGSKWLPLGHEKSYINRAVALYRHFAGIPTDLEPPAAP